MARIRSIKPEIWESEKLGKLPALTRLTFVGLISIADDEGRGRAAPRFLLGRLHPYALEINESDITNALKNLNEAGLIRTYSVEDYEYYCIPGWLEHQKIDRPRKSVIPRFVEDSTMVRRILSEDSSKPRRSFAVGVEWSGMEWSGVEGKGSTTAKCFDEFWERYPRKEAKHNARQAWKKIKPDDTLVKTMLQAIERQSETKTWKDGYIPHPATWLNGRRWEDEVIPTNGAQSREEYDATK